MLHALAIFRDIMNGGSPKILARLMTKSKSELEMLKGKVDQPRRVTIELLGDERVLVKSPLSVLED